LHIGDAPALARFTIQGNKEVEKREVFLHASLTKYRYAKLKPCFVIGIVRMRSPVAVKIALQPAGRISGNAGLLSSVGGLLDFRKCTSMKE